MIRNLEVTRQTDHYRIAEQAGSEPKQTRTVHEAESAEAARQWLQEQGAPLDTLAKAFEEFKSGKQVFVEIPVAPESEGFPRQ